MSLVGRRAFVVGELQINGKTVERDDHKIHGTIVAVAWDGEQHQLLIELDEGGSLFQYPHRTVALTQSLPRSRPVLEPAGRTGERPAGWTGERPAGWTGERSREEVEALDAFERHEQLAGRRGVALTYKRNVDEIARLKDELRSVRAALEQESRRSIDLRAQVAGLDEARKGRARIEAISSPRARMLQLATEHIEANPRLFDVKAIPDWCLQLMIVAWVAAFTIGYDTGLIDERERG